MKNKRRKVKRAAAMLLAALMVVNSADLTAFTAYAAQAEHVPEETEKSESSNVMTITGFEELEEDVMKQQLPVGASEEEIDLPNTLNVTVFAAEEQGTDDGEESAQTKNVTLTDITWEIDAAESDGVAFDSCEDCDGFCYVYTPVLPETDADGNTVILEEDVETPVIYVLIGESDHVSAIAVDGYDEEGFCEGYSWVDGSLVKNTEEEATTCSHGGDCNGYQPAVLLTQANISNYTFTQTTTGDESENNITEGCSTGSTSSYIGYYAITNAGQLYWFAAHVNANTDNSNQAGAVLTNDITVNSLLSEKLDTDGTVKADAAAIIRNWTPIGYQYHNSTSSGLTTQSSEFKGTFDGQNHTISGIYCNISETNYGVGLFGCLYGGTISNVIVADSYLKGNEYVGGICGRIDTDGGTIKNCTNEATVTGTGYYVGGICGNNHADKKHTCTVSNCTNSGTISGKGLVGGIGGDLQYGTLENCTNSGSVTGTDNYVGGTCGHLGAGGTISKCTNTAGISGVLDVGGICGHTYDSTTTINDCHNSGSITGSGPYHGGICGTNYGEIVDCTNQAGGEVYVNSQVGYIGGICGRNFNKLKDCTNKATVTGYQKVGGICGENENETTVGHEAQIESCTNEGTVTVYEPTGTGFSQIGGVCGYNVSGTITDSTNKGTVGVSSAEHVGGICGKNQGTVSGSTNEGGAVSGKNNVGGICGTSSGKIENCTNHTTVQGSGLNAGGICGSLTSNTITGCMNETTGTVTGKQYVGGICGFNTSSADESIKTCENKGSVTGTEDHVGGVCGTLTGTGAIVSSKNTDATVTGTERVGGICGEVGSTCNVSVSMKDCTSSGSVTGTGDYVGGICGVNPKGMEGCTNSATVTGTERVGGICGMFSASSTGISISNCENTGAVTGSTAKTSTDICIGGICGWNGAGSITESSNSATVTGNAKKIGGICGYNNEGEMSSCQNQGDVNGQKLVGGICGQNTASDKEFKSCTNSGNITGVESAVGGICGSDDGGITIYYSSNSGTISGTEKVGGICGYAGNTTIKHSYNTGSISGTDVVGGIAGSAGKVSYVYSTGAVTGTATSKVTIGEIYGSATLENVSAYYYLDTMKTGQSHADDTDIHSKTQDQFASGAVAWLLNNSSSDNPTWYQNIDNDKVADSSPGLDNTHGTVYPCTTCTGAYSNTADTSKAHSNFKPTTDTDVSKMHACGLCGAKVAHSGVVYKADTANTGTILAFCKDCGWQYEGSITLSAPTELIYDATEKASAVTKNVTIPEGISATVTASADNVTYAKVEDGTETPLAGDTKPTDAGTYKATLTLTGDDNVSASVSITYTIAQATPTVTWSDTSTPVRATYTGKSISATDFPAVTVKGVGDADITGNYTGEFTYSYCESKGAPGIGGGTSGLPTTAAFTEGLPTEVGQYLIKVSVSAKGNYREAETATYLTLMIDWLDITATATLTDQGGNAISSENKWAQSVTFTAPEGFSISNSVGGTYGDTFTVDNNGSDTGSNGVSVTYYLKDTTTDEIAQKEATVYIDRTAPTFPAEGSYGIQISDTDNWFKSLLNTISFGLLYQNRVEVNVKGTDALSGVDKYYYHIDTDTTPKTAAELDALREAGKFESKDANSSNAVTVATLTNNDATKNYVVYAYAVDKAGNSSAYICSDGVVVDDETPTITLTAPTEDAETLTDRSAAITLTASEAGTYFYVYNIDTSMGIIPSSQNQFATSVLENGKTTWTAIDGVSSRTMTSGDNTITLSNLQPNTRYILGVMAVDSVGNATSVVMCNFTTRKTMPKITEQPKITGTYGQKLSDMTLTDGTAVYDGVTVEGNWKITEADAESIYPTVNGATKYEVTFTPDDEKYAEVTVEVVPVVAPKELTYTVTATDRAFKPNDDKVDITVNLEGIVDGDTVDVANAESLQATISGTDIGRYAEVTLPTLTLTGEDKDNYSLSQTTGEYSLTTPVVISQAQYENHAITKQYYYAKDYADQGIQLSDYLPEGYGTVDYEIIASPDDSIVQNCRITDGQLSYDVCQADHEGDSTRVHIIVITKNYQDFNITVMFKQISQLPVVLKKGSSVTLKNSVLTYGEALSKLEFHTAVFVSQDDPTKVITGTLAWTNSTFQPTAGTTSADWTFTPDNPEYATLTGDAAITINKATPVVVTAPTVTMTYNPNMTLAGIDLNTAGTNVTAGIVKGVDGNTLPGTWNWNVSSQVPQVNNSGYKATFTPEDKTNYASVDYMITVTVSKATPVVEMNPTAAAITYGQTLGDSAITGTVYYDDTYSTTVQGSWSWADETIVPTATTDSDKTEYTVTFTPSDADNYNEITKRITLTVERSANTPDIPDPVKHAAYGCETVSDVELPDGWIWDTEDSDLPLEVGVAVTATAIYDGADKGNYVTESVEITITIPVLEYVKELTKAVEDITEETVTAADTEALEIAKEALEKVLEDYAEKVTEEEKTTVTKEISRIEAALAKIAEAYPSGVVRLAGADRYETAYKTADALKKAWNVEKFEAAIITTGKKFADALSGSYLAAVKQAPILLTNGKENNVEALVDYIKANVAEGSTVYILGGENAVTTDLDTIEGYNVKRLSGNDRYETNLQILQEAGLDGQEELIVTTGREFADGLCAAATARPILLVKNGRALTEEQKAIAEQFKVGKIYILGGESAVDADIENVLKAIAETEESVIRLSGDSRYETSVKVAETFFEAPRAVIAAYGKNFPDGLCAGPLAAALNIPLLLTRDGYTEDGAAYIKGQNITSGYVLGGTDVLSDETVREVFALADMME